MSPDQIKRIHILKHQAKLDDAAYRTVLRTVAGVASCKDLDQRGFEDVMGVIEGMADDAGANPGNYWRNVVARRSLRANPRMERKILAQFKEYEQLCDALQTPPGNRYKLGGLVSRASSGRTHDVHQLAPREAWNLIESLKAILDREENARAEAPPEVPVLSAAGDLPF